MRIALVNTFTPYVRGGAEILVDNLTLQLRLHGHQVDAFKVPFPDALGSSLVSTISAVRMMRFDGYDRVIAFKFPAYCLRYPAKVIWLFHQFRQVYELWDTPYGLGHDYESQSLQAIVKSADGSDIPLARNIYTIAEEVSRRLMDYNGIGSSAIYPPLQNSDEYYNECVGDYLFYPSRITDLKRQLLVVQAMACTKSNVKLVIAGVSEDNQYMEAIIKTIKQNHLEKKIEVHNEWISDKMKLDLYAKCLGVIFTPYHEDYGFITLEAFYSSKPLITCIDSGGSMEFVDEGKTGYAVEPSPQAIALAMDRLYENKVNAERMGIEARRSILQRNISWPETIRRLLI